MRCGARRRREVLRELRRARDPRLMRLSPRLPAAIASVPFAVASIASTVLARGGGGGHGGGGHSSGGGGHWGGGSWGGGYHGGSSYPGSSGGGVSNGFVVTIAIIAVVIVMVLLFVLLFRLIARSNATAAQNDPLLETAAIGAEGEAPIAEQRPLTEVEAALEAIRSADPDFEPETFLQRAEMAFFLVSRAYQNVDAKAGRPYLTADAFATWKRDLDAFAASQRRPIFDDLNVRGIHVSSASHGDAGDEIIVHFDVVYRLRIIDANTGATVNDDGEDRRRGQRWTFRRNAGVKSLVEGGAVALKCPECGAPLQLASDGRCKFCHADVSAGGLDWTVAGITLADFIGAQPEPLFGAQRLDPAAGFAAIKEADPQFDAEAFVGRIQTAFLALQEAWSTRDLDVGRAFMSPGLYYGWSTQVETMAAEGRKNVMNDVRVLAIAPVSVLHGRAVDDVTVRISASAVDYEIDEKSGAMVFGSTSPEAFTEFWTFQRSTSAKTPEHGLLDKQCPNCGAPLDVNQIGQCHYCKAAVTSGKFDWVLSRIEQAEEVAYA
jgi:predicted lipid-binding transport protein (Tim44 family)